MNFSNSDNKKGMDITMKNNYEFWFITGSQHLYGEETLKQVSSNGEAIAKALNAAKEIPYKIVFKPIVTTPDEITAIIKEANYNDACAGIITWMHTFSPSKMWIAGLSSLQKPMLHLHTQFNSEIPWASIDMDFMNLNQSAHGDREHGFIGTRLRLKRKVIAGHWQDETVRERIGDWQRSAIGVAFSKALKVIRFGDNMRQVAVTEGDKVEAEIKLGWAVNTYGVGDLVKIVNDITEPKVDALIAQYKEKYIMATDDISSVRIQAKYELALKKMLEKTGAHAFTTTFEDLHGLEQLPGLACQRLMEQGFGFGGEGDWKTSAMTAIMKEMSAGLQGGTSFMEDYTYHLKKGEELILGAHMLEVCPSIAANKPKIEVHPLGIGGKNPPARMVFDGKAGNAIVVSLIDMGGRMRMIVNDVEAVTPLHPTPKLPVARVMWKPLPSLSTSAECWLIAGGAHHSVMSYALTAEHMRDFAEMLGIEFVHINKDTTVNELKKELMWNEVAFKVGV